MILYVSYTDLPGHAPYFKALEEGADTIELITRCAPDLGQVATQIHSAGKPDEPLIEIVTITKRAITSDEAQMISQGAVNFLMEQGALPLK